jgi:hypothetical protein
MAGRLGNLCVSGLTALGGSDDSILWRDGDEIANGISMCKEDGAECEDSFSTMTLGRVVLIGKGR